MLSFYGSLDEACRRRFAALEAQRIGHGGLAFVEVFFGITHKTVANGADEINGRAEIVRGRVRRPGGGAKSKLGDAAVRAAFEGVMSEHTAGSPEEEDERWTYLNEQEIADLMMGKGVGVSRTVVRQLLRAGKYVKRKSQKNKAMGESGNRNEQFENIKKVVRRHQRKGDAVVSMDTKKKNP